MTGKKNVKFILEIFWSKSCGALCEVSNPWKSDHQHKVKYKFWAQLNLQ